MKCYICRHFKVSHRKNVESLEQDKGRRKDGKLTGTVLDHASMPNVVHATFEHFAFCGRSQSEQAQEMFPKENSMHFEF